MSKQLWNACCCCCCCCCFVFVCCSITLCLLFRVCESLLMFVCASVFAFSALIYYWLSRHPACKKLAPVTPVGFLCRPVDMRLPYLVRLQLYLMILASYGCHRFLCHGVSHLFVWQRYLVQASTSRDWIAQRRSLWMQPYIRLMLCIARSLPPCGVRLSVCHTPVLSLNG